MKLADLIINLKWMDTTPLAYALKIVGHCFLIAKSVGSRSLTLVCDGSKLTNFSYIAIFYPFTIVTLVTLKNPGNPRNPENP